MGAANTGGSGNSKSEMKKKAKKDTQVSAYEKEINKQKAAKAVKAKEDRQKKIREEQKNKRPTPKDDNKVIVPKKKIDFKPVTKEVLNPNNNIQEKKKTPIVKPKYAGGGEGGNNNTTTPKVKVAVIPKVDTAPTKVEVDQSSATDTATVAEPKKEDDIYARKRKAKARGRSMMTLTSAQGVKKDENLILGRRSLLGS